MITIYGIKNCDKCRTAQKWFTAMGVDFKFHDLRIDGLTDSLYKGWQATDANIGLLNRRSQTWRKIPEAERAELSPTKERQLAVRYPTVVKRPIVSAANKLYVGYDEAAWKMIL